MMGQVLRQCIRSCYATWLGCSRLAAIVWCSIISF